MDVSVITTYRCDSKCSMCFIWRNPSVPKEEISLETLARLPSGVDYLNLTGGEPTLRADLAEIVDLLYPKTKTLEISSNGLHTDRLENVVRKYPAIKIRYSLDGIEGTSDTIRGEKDGFNKKVRGLLRLKELGGKDLGFGVTIQDKNAAELADLYALACRHGVELASSALHNGFQFHKNDNYPFDRAAVAKEIERLIEAQLSSWNVKTWFRAYLNLGLIAKVLGQPRLLKCTAGTDFVFVDPWGDVFACNVRPDLKIGNLKAQSWEEIFHGERATRAREKVAACTQNCWMVGSAKTAMRFRHFATIPKPKPLAWVIANKLRRSFGRPVPFEKYVDYGAAAAHGSGPERVSYLTVTSPRRVQRESEPHYQIEGGFNNV